MFRGDMAQDRQARLHMPAHGHPLFGSLQVDRLTLALGLAAFELQFKPC
jgi:hypothetical protein